jgi:hypothetical protein
MTEAGDDTIGTQKTFGTKLTLQRAKTEAGIGTVRSVRGMLLCRSLVST